jgi:hypothetical protein
MKNVCDKHTFLSDGLGSSSEDPMVELSRYFR